MQLLKALWALAGAAICCFLIFVIHSQFLKEGQLAAGTCEIVTLDRDSSQPRRTIARQTARCACKKGQIAGTTRAKPACVDARIIKTKQWCEMLPCLEGEGCDLLINKSGWTCTQPVYTIDQRAKSILKWTNGTVDRVSWARWHGDHLARIPSPQHGSVTAQQQSLWNTAGNAGTALGGKYTKAHNGTWRGNDHSSTRKKNFDQK